MLPEVDVADVVYGRARSRSSFFRGNERKCAAPLCVSLAVFEKLPALKKAGGEVRGIFSDPCIDA